MIPDSLGRHCKFGDSRDPFVVESVTRDRSRPGQYQSPFLEKNANGQWPIESCRGPFVPSYRVGGGGAVRTRIQIARVNVHNWYWWEHVSTNSIHTQYPVRYARCYRDCNNFATCGPMCQR